MLDDTLIAFDKAISMNTKRERGRDERYCIHLVHILRILHKARPHNFDCIAPIEFNYGKMKRIYSKCGEMDKMIARLYCSGTYNNTQGNRKSQMPPSVRANKIDRFIFALSYIHHPHLKTFENCL